jgi:hypothetical protein
MTQTTSSLVQRLRAGHLPRPADSEELMESAANTIEQLSKIAHGLMRTCYDEANRLANHGSNGLEKLVMSHLYDAANAAKQQTEP